MPARVGVCARAKGSNLSFEPHHPHPDNPSQLPTTALAHWGSSTSSYVPGPALGRCPQRLTRDTPVSIHNLLHRTSTMYPSRLRVAQQLSRQCARSFTTSGHQLYSSSTVPAPEKSEQNTVQVTPTGPAAVVKQAPNRAEVWSRSQKPRSEAMTGPRFEQTNFDLQVSYGLRPGTNLCAIAIRTQDSGQDRIQTTLKSFANFSSKLQPQPWAAIELIHKQPVKWVHERIVACDGGGGPAGHPKIYINTDKPEIATCNYCGLPFVS